MTQPAAKSRKMRIGGIVGLANQIRQKLQTGIEPGEVERLQAIVTKSVQQIEKLCAEQQTQPTQLPTPSRTAYNFLKSINFDSAVTATGNSTIPASTLKLKNVLKQQSDISQQLFQIVTANQDTPPTLRSTLTSYTEQIETICTKNQLTPAALVAPSRAAYAWMKFLTDEHNLNLHLDTLRRAIRAGAKIISTKKNGVGEIFIELSHSSSLYRSRTINNVTTVRMSEGFIQSSDEILKAVLQIALFGKTEALTQLIRRFGQTEEYSDVLLELDLIAQITAETGQGNYYDLDEFFTAVNQEYFEGKMVKPRLIWCSFPSDRKFGHYERARDRVAISKTLDDVSVPQHVAEFVFYHELLHKHHGAQWVNGKCLVHTPEFKRSERRFQRYQEAEDYLRQMVEKSQDLYCHPRLT
jgi:hypothetical protein